MIWKKKAVREVSRRRVRELIGLRPAKGCRRSKEIWGEEQSARGRQRTSQAEGVEKQNSLTRVACTCARGEKEENHWKTEGGRTRGRTGGRRERRRGREEERIGFVVVHQRTSPCALDSHQPGRVNNL